MAPHSLGRRIAVGAALAVAGVVAYGMLVERNRFTLRQVGLRILPANSEPMRILHVSDMHVTPWQHGKQRWVRELASLEPDLVINTGDNWGWRDSLDAVKASFDEFAGIPGAFVFGSNDYEGPVAKNPFGYLAGPSSANKKPSLLDAPSLRNYLTDDLGWVDLNNNAASITSGNRNVELFGLDDAHHGHDRLDDMVDALSDVRGVSGEPALRLGVTHAPYIDTLTELGHFGADVLFAGHTHGGQVCVPGYGALVTNCDLPAKQASGLSLIEIEGRDVPLHVSAGLGTSVFAPVRFACPPEATLLTLLPVI